MGKMIDLGSSMSGKSGVQASVFGDEIYHDPQY